MGSCAFCEEPAGFEVIVGDGPEMVCRSHAEVFGVPVDRIISEEDYRPTAIEKRLVAVRSSLPWWHSVYEILQSLPSGARRIAEIHPVPNDGEDAPGRFAVGDFIGHAPEDVRWLLDEVARLRVEIEKARVK